MAITRAKWSDLGQAPGGCIDALALSPMMRRFPVVLNASAPMLVQSATRYLTYVVPASLGGTWTVAEAWSVFPVIPVAAGATATWSLRKCATDGSTFTTLVTGVTTLSGYTAFVANAMTLVNPTTTVSAGQLLIVTSTVDNTAVTTADVGASWTIYLEPAESAAISDDNVLVAPG